MVQTYRDKFNARYGFKKGSSHSLSEISKVTGYKKSGLEKIVEKDKEPFTAILKVFGRMSKIPLNGVLHESIRL